jgi:hypothetical protein
MSSSARTLSSNPVRGVDVCLRLSSVSVGMCRWHRAVTQAVSRRFPTAAARVLAQVTSCGICGGQSGTGACFLRVLRFPLLILIPPTVPHSSSSIIRVWYNMQISARRTNWTQSHLTPRTSCLMAGSCPFKVVLPTVANINTKLRGLSPQANYTDRATAAVGEVVPTFADRGCYVVSATGPHGR